MGLVSKIYQNSIEKDVESIQQLGGYPVEIMPVDLNKLYSEKQITVRTRWTVSGYIICAALSGTGLYKIIALFLA